MKTKYINSKIVAVVAAIFLFLIHGSSKIYSQSPKTKASSPSAIPSDLLNKLKQIEVLKEKIATKVAQIREKDKGGYYGTVKKIGEKSIIILTRLGEKKISYSDDTVFYSISDRTKKETKIEKVEENGYISALGYFDEDRKIISAKYIFLQIPSTHIIGKIADINKKNYTITIKGKEGDQVVDVEKYTKSYKYVKGKGWQRTGFSKFKIGDRTHVIGSINTKSNKVAAEKIYIISLPKQLKLSPTATSSSTKAATTSSKKETSK